MINSNIKDCAVMTIPCPYLPSLYTQSQGMSEDYLHYRKVLCASLYTQICFRFHRKPDDTSLDRNLFRHFLDLQYHALKILQKRYVQRKWSLRLKMLSVMYVLFHAMYWQEMATQESLHKCTEMFAPRSN